MGWQIHFHIVPLSVEMFLLFKLIGFASVQIFCAQRPQSLHCLEFSYIFLYLYRYRNHLTKLCKVFRSLTTNKEATFLYKDCGVSLVMKLGGKRISDFRRDLAHFLPYSGNTFIRILPKFHVGSVLGLSTAATEDLSPLRINVPLSVPATGTNQKYVVVVPARDANQFSSSST